MRLFIFACFTFLFISSSFGQKHRTESADQKDIKATITLFFDGMREMDSAKVASTLHPSIRFNSCFISSDSLPKMTTENVQEFLVAVGTPHDGIWDEQITSWDIKTDLHFAQVWAEYNFIYNKKFSHCGVDAFQLVKENGKWLIIQLTDTRRSNCEIKD